LLLAAWLFGDVIRAKVDRRFLAGVLRIPSGLLLSKAVIWVRGRQGIFSLDIAAKSAINYSLQAKPKVKFS
jgi:hypothetical protein